MSTSTLPVASTALALKRIHHIEFYVGNARQAAYYYRNALLKRYTQGYLNKHSSDLEFLLREVRREPGKNLDVHAHGGIAFAAVYYVNVPDNSGDLLLLDPRGGVNWFSETAGTNSSQIYHRIKPKAGHLVVFPGFLLHEVETNKSQDTRMCIANNIIVVPREFA